MKVLLLLLAVLHGTAAVASDIEKVGNPVFDKLFGQIDSLDNVLDFAEGRIVRLQREVALSLSMDANTPLVVTVYTIKERAGGDVRVMNIEGRPIVAPGMTASKQARDAASTLNEGTQEVSTMATDLSRIPGQINELIRKVEKLSDANDSTVQRNLTTAKSIQKRASAVTERARKVLDDVRKGIEATSSPMPPKARATPVAVQTIPDVLSKAWVAVKRDDLTEAQRLLDRADLLLPRQTRPVSRGDLVELFQMRSYVNLQTGDATAAAWAATQALVVYPTGVPLSKLGPAYAKLHRALAKTDLVKKVDVLSTGEGRAYLSGFEVTRGSTLQLGQGQHLLQIERDGVWESSVVYVREGFVVEL